MTIAIDTLMSEHRLIERALDALEAFADEVRRKTADDKAELGRFVTFIREFADAHHHGKEENLLFTAMVEAGFPRHGGPVAVMLMEHDHGRALVGKLAALASQEAPWSADDRQAVAEAANGFAALLHAHIHKEDAILYPMAEQRLDPALLDRVDADARAYDARQAAAGVQDRLTRLAEDLLSRHAPLNAPEHRPPPPFGGCGHA
ncbi:MAG TPA: hemerythrin domain-containing protein [Anaeromyxobacteraceae bacterium]|nr:hemerythrin domain-containing protein [Anaeromyxobacteraceae bacterium]